MNHELLPSSLLQAEAVAPASVGNVGVGFDILGHTLAARATAPACAASTSRWCASS